MCSLRSRADFSRQRGEEGMEGDLRLRELLGHHDGLFISDKRRGRGGRDLQQKKGRGGRKEKMRGSERIEQLLSDSKERIIDYMKEVRERKAEEGGRENSEHMYGRGQRLRKTRR
jgi:hypothetical protein